MRIAFSIGQPVVCGGIWVPVYYTEELKKRGYDAFCIADYSNPVLEDRCGEFRDVNSLNDFTDADVIIAVRWERCDELMKYEGRKIQLVQGNDRYYYESMNHCDLPKMLDKRNDTNWELIGVSQYCIDEFKRGIVIPNGIDERFFEDLGLERDIDALIEGNDEPLKNIDYAIEQAKKDGHKKIVWMGRETHFIQGIQTITNPIQEIIPSIYQRAKHFYKFSHSEGFSLPLWEATASGCIIHTHDMGCNKDWVYTKENAKEYTWENATNKLLEYLCK